MKNLYPKILTTTIAICGMAISNATAEESYRFNQYSSGGTSGYLKKFGGDGATSGGGHTYKEFTSFRRGRGYNIPYRSGAGAERDVASNYRTAPSYYPVRYRTVVKYKKMPLPSGNYGRSMNRR